MKKIIVSVLSIMLLTACSKERSEYQELLEAQFSKDRDVIDYHLDVGDMAACVTDQVADDIPGFPGSPIYASYFEAYQLLLRPENSADIPDRMEKAAEIFGSKKATNKARLDVTSHILFCMSQVREKQERSDNLFNFGDE